MLTALNNKQAAQRKEVHSLKERYNNLINAEKQLNIENEVYNVMRQVYDLERIKESLEVRNTEQKEELVRLTTNTDYVNQCETLQKEIFKQKKKHKMLLKLQKEEEDNFKDKFDALNDVVEQRHMLKTGINKAKNVQRNKFKTDSPDFNNKSMKRVTSHAMITNPS